MPLCGRIQKKFISYPYDWSLKYIHMRGRRNPLLTSQNEIGKVYYSIEGKKTNLIRALANYL